MSTRALPRHAVIAQALRDQIRDGSLTSGSPLPSEARLMERFAVSRGTVRQALAALRAEGLIAVSRGRVPVVRRSGLVQSFDTLVSFSRWAAQLGRVPSARTLELTRRPADAETAGRVLLDCDLDHGSVYEQLAERGVRLVEARQTISAIAAGARDSELLAIPRRRVRDHRAQRGRARALGHHPAPSRVSGARPSAVVIPIPAPPISRPLM